MGVKNKMGGFAKLLRSIRIKDVLNGSILNHPIFAGQLNFLLFLALIGFIYITHHYDVEKKLEIAATLSKENQELRYHSISTSSELMFISKQSEVIRQIEEAGIDLEQMTTPPNKIKMN